MNGFAELQAAVARHGRVARVMVAGHDGSSPREPGAVMLVWAEGTAGTIGGGALEWEATARARALLSAGEASAPHLIREPLGPKLGQCCGGAVQVLTELFDAATLPDPTAITPLWLRPISAAAQGAGPASMPFALRRLQAAQRRSGSLPAFQARLLQGWMAEVTCPPRKPLWIWGAGHVGRALCGVFAPLPDWQITWIDTAPERFPAEVPPGVETRTSEHPQAFTAMPPPEAHHLILTFSHALDLELCHRILLGGAFSFLGLIGSASKKARFRSRLKDLGHSEAALARLSCPIGDPAFGKHPQAIAISVAHQLLHRHSEAEITDDTRDRHLADTQRPHQSLSGRRRQQRRLL